MLWPMGHCRARAAAGTPLHHDYTTENVELVKAGCCNLARHIQNARKYCVPVVVAINRFAADTDAELQAVKAAALAAGAESVCCAPGPSCLARPGPRFPARQRSLRSLSAAPP